MRSIEVEIEFVQKKSHFALRKEVWQQFMTVYRKLLKLVDSLDELFKK